MRPIIIPAVAALGLIAVPAFAQSSGSTNSSSGSSGSSGASSASSSSPNSSMQIEQNLRHDLSKAGYTDIQIFPGSFMVHAKDSRGNPTEMMVSPNSLTQVTAMANTDQTGDGGNAQSGSGDTTTK